MIKEYYLKIKSWVLTHKLITTIIVLVIFSFVLFLYLQGKSKPGLPSVSPGPTAFVVSRMTPPTVYPLPGEIQTAGTKNAINLSFSKAVDLSTVVITSEPSLEFKITTLADFPRTVVFYPKTSWVDGTTYKIKVQKGIMSLDGTERLNEDINLEYKIVPFPIPNYDTEGGV